MAPGTGLEWTLLLGDVWANFVAHHSLRLTQERFRIITDHVSFPTLEAWDRWVQLRSREETPAFESPTVFFGGTLIRTETCSSCAAVLAQHSQAGNRSSGAADFTMLFRRTHAVA